MERYHTVKYSQNSTLTNIIISDHPFHKQTINDINPSKNH